MPYIAANSGVVVTDVSLLADGPAVPLGFCQLGTPADFSGQGDQIWMYVQNSAGAAWGVGTVVQRVAGSLTYACTVAAAGAASAVVVGVSQHIIAPGSYGFVLREGIGSVIADTGGVTANSPIVVGNAVAGTADNAGAGDAVIGVALTTAIATALATAKINCLG